MLNLLPAAYAPQEVDGGIQSSELLISEILNTTGYRNKLVGKWFFI